MENITKINDREYEAIDPVTGGKWKVVAPHPLSPEIVLIAITHVLKKEDIRPKKDATLTVEFELKIEGSKVKAS